MDSIAFVHGFIVPWAQPTFKNVRSVWARQVWSLLVRRGSRQQQPLQFASEDDTSNTTAVWVDGIKIAQWNWDSNGVDFDDEAMTEICDMARQEVNRAIKIMAVKRWKR